MIPSPLLVYISVSIICLDLKYFIDSISPKTRLLINRSKRFEEFSQHCLSSQHFIISSLESLEKEFNSNANFIQDSWDKYCDVDILSSYGITAVLQGGKVFEKAAVSTTFIKGIR